MTDNEVMNQATRVGMELITLSLAAIREGHEGESGSKLMATADNLDPDVAIDMVIFFSSLYAATLVDYMDGIDEAIKAHRDGSLALLADEE